MDGKFVFSFIARKYSVSFCVLTNDLNAILVGKLLLKLQVYTRYFKSRIEYDKNLSEGVPKSFSKLVKLN